MPALTSQTINNGTSGTAAYTSYDSQGRIAYTLAPSQGGTGLGAQTTYTYGYTPGAWTVTASTPNSTGGSHWTTTTLDGIGRTVKVQAGTGTNTVVSEVDTTYAPCACGPIGKMSWQSQPYLPPNGAPAGTTYSYDALGRTTNVLLADGASHTQYRYQGNFTTIIDPANKWKQYASDSFGNLVSVIEPDPLYNPAPPSSPPAYPVTSAPAQTLLTSYTYDQLGHLTQVRMPRSNGTQTRTFTYTLKSYATVVLPVLQLTAASNPENGTVSYTYNADGTVANKKDANGNTLTYTYDAYGRLLTSPAGSFIYDTCPNNDTFCTNTPGQMVEAVFGGGIGSNQLSFQYDYTYTPAGKVTGKTLTLQSANHISTGGVKASGSLAASYTYDNQGALTSAMYPTTQTWAGSPTQTLNYTLDAMERPTGLADSWSDNRTPTTYASGVGYTPANQTNFGGRTYNNLLQLTQVGSITYTYSTTQNNGQTTSSVDATTGETITYQYDALKRLATAAGSNWGEQHTYDGFGNLIQMQPSGTAGAPSLSVNVDPATNRLSTTGVSYDNNGNMWASGSMYLTYDTLNRVTQVQTSPSNSHYGYDPDNLRVYYQAANGTETIYFYGTDGRKLATYTYAMITNNGVPEIQLTQQSENVYFTGMMVRAEGSQVTLDRLGSAIWSHGSTHRYYPYGVEYHASGNDIEKYATYTRDGLTGLDYAVNRFYFSVWGRFISPDPYRANTGGPGDEANPQSWNRYVYAGNDPINAIDPSGNYYVLLYGGWCWGGGEDGGWYPCDIYRYGGPFMPVGTGGGGGGGGGDSSISISKLSLTNKKAVEVQNDLRWLQQAINQDSECAKWLEKSDQAIDFMLDAPGSGATAMMVGVGDFSDNTVNAVASTSGTNLTPGSMLITVNSNGAFFSSGPSSSVGWGVPSWIKGDTAAGQALILLHELAHNTSAEGFVNNDYKNRQAQSNNNKLVMQNCGNVVDLAGDH